MNPFHHHFQEILLQDLALRTQVESVYQLPGLEKGSLNLGMKDLVTDKKRILIGLLALEAISGQRAKATASRKMVASLKIRKEMILGCKVTLRGRALSSFLHRFQTLTLPRAKDFEGFHFPLPEKGIRKTGNRSLSFSLENPFAFLELATEDPSFPHLPPLDLTFLGRANKAPAHFSLVWSNLGFPIRRSI
jgi:large subunit ribosomal protein L5